MPKRRRLGPVYERSPAEKLKDWIVERIAKIIFTLVMWIAWLGVYYVFMGIVNFLAINMKIWHEERNTAEMMNSPASVMVIVVGMVLILIYVFRDPLKKKKKGYKR